MWYEAVAFLHPFEGWRRGACWIELGSWKLYVGECKADIIGLSLRGLQILEL